MRSTGSFSGGKGRGLNWFKLDVLTQGHSALGRSKQLYNTFSFICVRSTWSFRGGNGRGLNWVKLDVLTQGDCSLGRSKQLYNTFSFICVVTLAGDVRRLRSSVVFFLSGCIREISFSLLGCAGRIVCIRTTEKGFEHVQLVLSYDSVKMHHILTFIENSNNTTVGVSPSSAKNPLTDLRRLTTPIPTLCCQIVMPVSSLDLLDWGIKVVRHTITMSASLDRRLTPNHRIPRPSYKE